MEQKHLNSSVISVKQCEIKLIFQVNIHTYGSSQKFGCTYFPQILTGDIIMWLCEVQTFAMTATGKR